MKLQGLDDTMTATGVDRLDDTTTALIPLTARWDDVIDRKIDAVSSHARRLEGSADSSIVYTAPDYVELPLTMTAKLGSKKESRRKTT